MYQGPICGWLRAKENQGSQISCYSLFKNRYLASDLHGLWKYIPELRSGLGRRAWPPSPHPTFSPHSCGANRGQCHWGCGTSSPDLRGKYCSTSKEGYAIKRRHCKLAAYCKSVSSLFTELCPKAWRCKQRNKKRRHHGQRTDFIILLYSAWNWNTAEDFF